MSKTKADKERSSLNKKLLGETFKQEIGKKKGFDWRQFTVDIIGCFTGIMITDYLRETTAMRGILLFVVEVAIMVAVIVFVELILSVTAKLIRRN